MQPIPLRQLVWSRYLERERGIKGEAIKKCLTKRHCFLNTEINLSHFDSIKIIFPFQEWINCQDLLESLEIPIGLNLFIFSFLKHLPRGIFRHFLIVLQYEAIDCILQSCRYEKLNLFLFVRHVAQPQDLQ
jgi:hypothetical protein